MDLDFFGISSRHKSLLWSPPSKAKEFRNFTAYQSV
jgi:hypothetical protein